MRLLPFLFALAGVAWLGSVTTARAQMLTGTLLSAAGDSVNLNSSTGFAAYTTIDGKPYTDLGNVGSFTQLTGGSLSAVYDSEIKMSFDGYMAGSSTDVPANNETVLVNGSAGETLTITSTLFATAETFDFYVGSNTGQTTLTAVLTGSDVTTPVTYTEKSILSPTDPASNFNGYGDLNLVVSGAVGDTLTFSIEDNLGYGGLQGVTVVAPEPSTWALFLGGASLLLAWRGRKPA